MAASPQTGGGRLTQERGGRMRAHEAKPVTPAQRDCYAVASPGLEMITAAELRAIGIEPRAVEPGGVAFRATDEELFAANLQLRTASRVLVRVAEFRATAFHELERLARSVQWERFVSPGGRVRLRVTCRKSRLYHSDGVAERVADGVTRRVKGAILVRTSAGDDDDEPGEPQVQLFVVRFDHDVCSISADSSGELLHRRGYRLATAKAPIRETLAAAMLLSLGWDGSAPLVDPMCGAGTIPIEGALIARRIAPGLGRRFSCEQWPGAPVAGFARLRSAARARVVGAVPAPIVASDRDAGAVAAAQANAARAGVGADIVFERRALSALQVPPAPGLLLTNPPYGVRVSDRRELRDLYSSLGNLARAKCPGWTLAFLSADRVLDAQLKLKLDDVLRFRNGGIPVRLVRSVVPG